jgi:electron transfer flavoprotein alpha subunit
MSERVWVVLQVREGRIPRISWEALAAAQRLAAALGGSGDAAPARAAAVLLGSGLGELAAEVARRDLAAVRVADHPLLASYTPGAMIGVLGPALAAARPDFVVFPHTYQTVDFAPRLAQSLGAAWVPEVTAFEMPAAGDGDGGGGDGSPGPLWTRPIMGGKVQAQVRVRGGGTALVSVQSGAFSAEAAAAAHPAAPANLASPADIAGQAAAAGGAAAEIVQLAVDPALVRPDREVLGYEQVAAQQVDLTKADAIVAVGRGIGGADKMGPIEDLARALGAEIGASRPVIDSGWLPRERQIGSSGQTVSPRLYVAAGISGAIQHLVGMKASAVIVAINKDPSAPIFTVADYGVVGDLHEVVPALAAAVRAAKGT